MKRHNLLRNDSRSQHRVIALSVAVVILFFLLLTRLWYLQVIESDTLRGLSESNRLRFVPVAASRGMILDRNGKVLVNNTPSFSVAAIPQEVKDRDELLVNLAGYLNLDRDELVAKWDKGKGRAKYYPIFLASGITRDELELLEENRLRLPGMDIEMKPVRVYPNGLLASHLLGYLGEINETELESDEFSKYNPGDYVGKSGVERSWERYLHGNDGGRQIEVDARGRYLRTISESRPTIGNSLVLTLDLELQKQTEATFGDQAGAAVVMAVGSGEILAFASNPAYDPTLFSGRLSREQWQKYLDDKRHPMENKALKGQYPPGSTFKVVTALAGLQEGLVTADTTVVCKGSYTVGNNTFNCWNRHGHGTVNLKKALKESCDVYFYQLGEKLGVDRIAHYAREFGLGKPMGVGLDNEKGGLVPTTEWKEKKLKQKWFRGETLPVSIGQGYLLLTPIQLASMIATVASDGVVYRPHLTKKIVDPEGKTVREFVPEVLGKSTVRPDFFRAVKEGLYAVVNDPGGTGANARLYEVKVAGKTGTSQVVKLGDKKKALRYEHRDHALFVAFAPYDKPEVAVAVVLEHGGGGGAAAAPLAGRILKAYFEGKGVVKKGGGKSGVTDDEDTDEAAAEETGTARGSRPAGD
jgi:penicillin-binding protein 2